MPPEILLSLMVPSIALAPPKETLEESRGRAEQSTRAFQKLLEEVRRDDELQKAMERIRQRQPAPLFWITGYGA